MTGERRSWEDDVRIDHDGDPEDPAGVTDVPAGLAVVLFVLLAPVVLIGWFILTLESWGRRLCRR